ncbi:MAG: hypothetical protein A2X86_10710 [Bdellovibrionales bacterium GWA2_49_15]|nr:MAG: hypothetical protein A2X86_10710 [Bdellovibrionales bacterium GWA2_49_15]HAZ11446.1 hypothetical protein [Bdellovibrionales bacterium]
MHTTFSENFYRDLKAEVFDYLAQNRLRPKGAGRMYGKVLTIMSGWLVSYIFMLSMTSLHPNYMYFGLPAMLFFMLCMQLAVMHDGSHQSVSENKTINSLAAWTLAVAGASPYTWYQLHCVAHHNHTNIYGMDMDTQTSNIIRLHPGNKLFWYQKWQHLYAWPLYTLHTLRYLVLDDLVELITNRWKLTPRQKFRTFVEIMLIKSWQLTSFILLPLWVGGTLQTILLFWLFHWMAMSFLVTITFNLAHVTNVQKLPLKKSEASKDWAIHQLDTTADFAVGNRFLGWVIGGLNFQVEHHIFPSICHIHYPAIQKIVKRHCHEKGVTYHEYATVSAAVRDHYLHLKNLGYSAIK